MMIHYDKKKFKIFGIYINCCALFEKFLLGFPTMFYNEHPHLDDVDKHLVGAK
jgi:hypothetical protein